MRRVYSLDGRSEEYIHSFEKPRWVDNTRMHLTEMLVGMNLSNWIDTGQDANYWRHFFDSDVEPPESTNDIILI